VAVVSWFGPESDPAAPPLKCVCQVNDYKNSTGHGLAPERGFNEIPFTFHNIHIIIVQMAVSSISDSDVAMQVYHSEIAWFHCSHSYLIDSFLDPATHKFTFR
jgi:hypothetical protein